jgi:DNA-binding transcriptional ArsR family regulator
MTDYLQSATILKAMGHPIRLQILDLLRQGETCVCHIEHIIGKRQAYISQQLITLRNVNLVQTRKDGLQVHYRISNSQVSEILELFYGEKVTEHQYLDDCPCPTCTTIPTIE